MTEKHGFLRWCSTAVSGIRFTPDREAVFGELMDHLNDHFEDLRLQGLDEDTAGRLALEAMGDAQEIAPQLAAIHRPFWGYVLRLTQVVLALVSCALVLCIGWRLFSSSGFQPTIEPFAPNATERFTCEQTIESDGYTFTLTNVALGDEVLYFQVEVFNPRPWAVHTDVLHWFYAVDSLGTRYPGMYNTRSRPILYENSRKTDLLTYTHSVSLAGFPVGKAEWVEIRYDRADRDLVFRIDLTGGDGA